jgi:tetratricopeptide (TPR) repeat protein
MDQEHVSSELMRRFFRSELSRQDTREVLRHLVRLCNVCLDTAVQIGAEEGYIYKDGDFGTTLLPGTLDEAGAEQARERLRGIGLWHTLEKQDQDRRLAMIREDPRMQTWGLYDRLLEKCRDLGFRSPAYAAGIAELALAVAETLDPARHEAGRIADLRAGALAALGNARRLSSDFVAAAKAFRDAREALGQGTDDPLEEASLLSLEASLLKDLGDFELAAERLDRAALLYRDRQAPHLEGRIYIQQGATIGFVRPEKAIEVTRKGLALIDAVREPRLEMCGRHQLAHLLNDAGHPGEALAMLEASRPFYAQFNDPWTRVRLHWLEGKIARALGDLPEAEETFKRLWYDLQEPEQTHELTLLSLDLAEVYVTRGKHEEALELVEEFVPLLQEWGMHAEGIAMWLLMACTVQERRAEAALFRRMAEYLTRAWFQPIQGREP